MKLGSDLTYAVVGASRNRRKYGFKVFKNLLESGKEVIPINPKGGEILGQHVYPTLKAYQGEIDLAVFVVPPQVTEKVLKTVDSLGIDQVWLQPGSESERAIAFCQNNEIQVVHQACIMKQS